MGIYDIFSPSGDDDNNKSLQPQRLTHLTRNKSTEIELQNSKVSENWVVIATNLFERSRETKREMALIKYKYFWSAVTSFHPNLSLNA